jgi:hypothetical protein
MSSDIGNRNENAGSSLATKIRHVYELVVKIGDSHAKVKTIPSIDICLNVYYNSVVPLFSDPTARVPP